MPKPRLNAVTLEMLWTRLISIVDEASATFVRTSFSTLVREANDFAVVLTDAKGRSLAQSSMSIPSFIGSLPATVKHFLQRFPAQTLKPGEQIRMPVLFFVDPKIKDDPDARDLIAKYIHDLGARTILCGNPKLAVATALYPDLEGRFQGAIQDAYKKAQADAKAAKK